MKAREFPGQTMIIGAAPGVNEHALELEIYGLPVLIEQKPDGKMFTSVWLPSAEDIEAMQAGAAVVVSCYHAQVPIRLDVAHVEVLP